ncbi:MAG: winged helix-turn-helix domain-containing protein [Acidimicrobiales bacterium]
MIYLDARLVLVGDRVITMPHKELDILAVLVGAAGRVLALQELIHQVWGPHRAPIKLLDVHIRCLRRRIEPDSHHPRYIHAVRGLGHIFDRCPPDHAVPPTSYLARGGMGRV